MPWGLISALLMMLAARNVSANESGCLYADIYKSEGPKPENLLVAGVVNGNCPNLMSIILKNEKPEDIYNSIEPFLVKMSSHFNHTIAEAKGKTEDDPEAKAFQDQLKNLSTLSSFLKADCPDEKESGSACKARSRLIAFGIEIKEKADAAIADEEAEKKRGKAKAHGSDPERLFKLKYCKSPNLWAVLYVTPQPIQSKCIYSLDGPSARMYVIQSTAEGVLVGQPNSLLGGKVFLIRTKQRYADGDAIQSQFVRSTGLFKYRSVAGAEKTVNSFQHLGDGVSVETEN